MIEFRQKIFAAKEYDAMKSLYNELMKKDSAWRYKIKVIDSASLLPILRGNNVVIERFVISTQFGKKDKYRMYLKIGAKAKLPDDVRLPGSERKNTLFRSSLKFNTGGFFGQKNNSETEIKQKEFKGGPAPDIIVVLCLVTGNLDVNGLLNSFGIVFGGVDRAFMGNLGKGSVSVI